MQQRAVCLIRAPSNLGLRPLGPGHEPGTWRAPRALSEAGLVERLAPARVVDLDRPTYNPRPPGTALLNEEGVRAFGLQLDRAVAGAIGRAEFPLVLGGDCSVLLGALAGARRSGCLSLVHIDGHSDFRHPGNYDSSRTVGAVAGMDLALVTGRGERVLTAWPGIEPPLVPDGQVVQIGERESRDPDFAWPDVAETAITRLDVFAARSLGPEAVLERTWTTLDRKPTWPFWLHLDVDVLDQTIMPAVDSPGSPGVDPDDLVTIVVRLLESGRCAGMTVTIFDPDLDADGSLAAWLVGFLGRVWHGDRGVKASRA